MEDHGTSSVNAYSSAPVHGHGKHPSPQSGPGPPATRANRTCPLTVTGLSEATGRCDVTGWMNREPVSG
jgi:hypothetical protein